MANEITWAQTEGEYGHDYLIAQENAVAALYANNNLLESLVQVDISSWSTDSARFPKHPVLAAAALTDGTTAANSAYSPAQVSLAVGEVGLMLTATDLNLSGIVYGMDQYGAEMGRAVAEKLQTDIAALFAAFSVSVGATTVAITEAVVNSAVTTLEVAKVPGPYVLALHPKPWGDLKASIGSTFDAMANTGLSARGESNDLFGARPEGMIGPLYGTIALTNTQIPTINAGADRACALYSAKRALAYVEKWPVRVELERDASLRGTEIVTTACYAVGELDDTSGVLIIADA